MAIGLTGSPQRMTPGYNPVYWYATSDQSSQPNFRYLFTVKNYSESTTLANLKILPRYQDNLLEVNLSKILDGDLNPFSDDLDLNSVTNVWNNAPGSGYRYSVEIGEEYTYYWSFDDVVFGTGSTVWLVSQTASQFSLWDQVTVTDAAEYYDFTDNNFNSGLVGFLTVDDLSSTLSVGNTVTIQQDPTFTFRQYNGSFTVSSISSSLLTVNFPFQGNTPAEPGTIVHNLPYDGSHLVTSVGATISGGPYDGYYYIRIDQDWIDNSVTHGGTVRYADGRVTSNPGDLTRNDFYVFNGAASHNDWINWASIDYDPSGNTQNWLTTVPDNYKVSLDNDLFLNIWGNKIATWNFYAEVTTYDSSNTLNGQFILTNNNGNTTEIKNVSVGPRALNSYATYSIVTGSGPIIDCDVSYYTVQVFKAFGITQSDALTFSVDCLCEARYTNYPILFMDRFGSLIPFNFSLNNKQSVDVSRDMYKKFIGGLNSGSYTYDTTEHSMRIYNVDLEERWEVNTDYMDESTSIFFEQLVTSPIAFILKDGNYVAINIESKKYDRIRKNNKKLIRYTLEISMSNNNTINI